MADVNDFIQLYLSPADTERCADILLGAIVLLGHYPNWCQGKVAVSTDGRCVKTSSPEAVAWSIEGAVAKLSNPQGIAPPNLLWYLDHLVYVLTGRDEGVGWYNDYYDHGTVIDFLIEAYRRLP